MGTRLEARSARIPTLPLDDQACSTAPPAACASSHDDVTQMQMQIDISGKYAYGVHPAHIDRILSVNLEIIQDGLLEEVLKMQYCRVPSNLREGPGYTPVGPTPTGVLGMESISPMET
jgi:hypothetical protein